MKWPLVLVLASLAGTGGAARASNLLDLQYDARTDELVAVIAFRGSHPDHRFSLQWGKCQRRSSERMASGVSATYGVSALVIDAHGADVTKENYEVTARFDLATLACRPARVTLRSGPRNSRTVSVPARPASARGS